MNKNEINEVKYNDFVFLFILMIIILSNYSLK